MNQKLLDMSLDLESQKFKNAQMQEKYSRHNVLDIEIENMRRIMLENETSLQNEISITRNSLEEW